MRCKFNIVRWIYLGGILVYCFLSYNLNATLQTENASACNSSGLIKLIDYQAKSFYLPSKYSFGEISQIIYDENDKVIALIKYEPGKQLFAVWSFSRGWEKFIENLPCSCAQQIITESPNIKGNKSTINKTKDYELNRFVAGSTSKKALTMSTGFDSQHNFGDHYNIINTSENEIKAVILPKGAGNPLRFFDKLMLLLTFDYIHSEGGMLNRYVFYDLKSCVPVYSFSTKHLNSRIPDYVSNQFGKNDNLIMLAERSLGSPSHLILTLIDIDSFSVECTQVLPSSGYVTSAEQSAHNELYILNTAYPFLFDVTFSQGPSKSFNYVVHKPNYNANMNSSLDRSILRYPWVIWPENEIDECLLNLFNMENGSCYAISLSNAKTLLDLSISDCNDVKSYQVIDPSPTVVLLFEGTQKPLLILSPDV